MPTVAIATVTGHLYGPVELSTDRDGKTFARVRFWTKDKPAKDAEAEFTSWNGFVRGLQAEWIARDAKKGSLIQVSGMIRMAKWTDKAGETHHGMEFSHVHNAIILDRRDQEEQQAEAKPRAVKPVPSAATSAIIDDEPPF